MSLARPSARRRRLRAVFAACLAVGSGAAASAPSPAAAGANEPKLDTRERAVVHRVNAVRAREGLPRLAFGGRLSRAADRHSHRSLIHRRIGHRLPGERSLGARLAQAARQRPIGEVVFSTRRGAGSAEIVRTWMRSPSHRAVLLSGSYRRAGVGIRTGRGGLYATVDLAAG